MFQAKKIKSQERIVFLIIIEKNLSYSFLGLHFVKMERFALYNVTIYEFKSGVGCLSPM